MAKTGKGAVLVDDEAVKYGWNCLWHAGQEGGHSSVRVLDALQLHGGHIDGWLFTSTSNTIKSRKKGNWNLKAVMEKVGDPGRHKHHRNDDGNNKVVLKAHYLHPAQPGYKSKDGRKVAPRGPEWRLMSAGETHDVLSTNSTAHAMVLYPHVTGTISFAEIILEVKLNSKEANPAPKITTYMLYRGSRIDVTGGAMSTNEKLEKEAELDSLGVPPDKLVCLNKNVTSLTNKFIVHLKKELDVRGGRKIKKLVAVVLLEAAPDESKLVWLHHVKQIDFLKQHDTFDVEHDDDARQEWHERRSNASEISTGSDSWHRIAKCMGDFCQYPLNEEEANAMIDNADANGNFKIEVKRALARHRKDPNAQTSPTREVNSSALEADDRRSGANDDTAPLPDEKEQKRLGRKVPFKTVALCRQDSETWEIMNRTNLYDPLTMPWPETLYDWWFRVGKSLSNHMSGAGVPISGAHSIGNAMLKSNPVPEDGDEDSKGTGGPLKSPKKVLSLSELSEPIGQAQVSKTDEGDAVFDINNRNMLDRKVIQYDLQEQSFSGHTRRSVGQMSWYYSSVNVCQTCYYTYRDIDRRRAALQKKSLRAMRKHMALVSGKSSQEYEREIEKKIFEQRKFATKLSAPKIGEASDYFGSNSSLRSGTSPSLDGVRKRGPVRAPKGALPPLPWQLRDEEAAREYQANTNKFNSSIVRNIRGKAQGMAQLVQQDRMKERVEAKKKRMIRGGMLDDNSQLLDGPSMVDGESEWQEFIGQSRAEFEQERAKKPARKVIGGLGENRPKHKSKNFDTNRLKHQWQRDADELAAKVRGYDVAGKKHSGHAEPKEHEQVQEDTYMQKQMQNLRRRSGKENRPEASVQDSNPFVSNGLAQGSMVSQLTMEPSMANIGNYPPAGIGQSSQSSLDGLDDEDWIRAVMVSGKGSNVNLAELSYASSPQRSEVKTPNRKNQNVTFKNPSPANKNVSPVVRADDEEDDDDDDDEEGVGWSPFVIPG